MEMPKHSVVINDPRKKNASYELLSYRALSEQEALGYLQVWMRTHRQRAKANQRLTIVTMVGVRD